MTLFNLIVAFDQHRGISKNQTIPWSLPKDLQHFKQKTLNSYIIMGRLTWLSLKKKLPQRTHIVISTTLEKNDEHSPDYIFKDLETCLSYLQRHDSLVKYIFIIGGSRLYKEAILYNHCQYIYTTQIYHNYECDNFFPSIPFHFKTMGVSPFQYDNDTYYRYITYKKIDLSTPIWYNFEEKNYYSLLQRILKQGIEKNDRTGVGTLSLFAETLSYDISDTFPILTTRKQFFRGIFEELLFYLRGQTNNQILVDKGIHIWSANTSKEFLEKNNLHLEQGDMGPTYGFNFRHFGAEYDDCDGVDQLQEVINLIKNNPDSRRIIISLWDPKNNKKCALPSCLCWYQFYVRNGFLDLLIHIRSSDYFLANNWNTCTGALFVYLICHLKDIHLKPGKLTVNMGDVHIYKTHIKAVEESLEREPQPFPKLHIHSEKECITDFNFKDVELIGYTPQENIKVDMAI